MFKKSFFIFLIFLFSTNANGKEIKITSDKLEIMRIENISIFSGNVYAYESNLKIWSDKLVVISSKDEKTIEKIDAIYNVKILRDELSIYGNEAEYDLLKNTLIVQGNVKIEQNESIILCDEIVVDLNDSSSIMKSDATKRVKAFIISVDSD